ncbi:hypothetical protein [Flammeovirga sp. OC4]|uniref:hypothetical protein n=1 Tax=Flammeovirga sp. OC4 TaxID=1382345 RepID=UPI0005C5440F|nr:hypothetical protein [Flammeovirga sp. OC4]
MINGEMVLFEGGLSRGPSQAGKWNRKEKIIPSSFRFVGTCSNRNRLSTRQQRKSLTSST